MALLVLLTVVLFGITACSKTGHVEEKRTGPITLEPRSRTEVKTVGFNYDEDKLNYELVWSDEFNYTGAPDPSKWEFETGGHGWGNNELQYYTRGDNVHVDGEKMIITARHEERSNREVTSTRIRTAKKGDWVYGKIEVRAKIPSGRGTWPAIWMLPTDWVYGGWPASGEIDIMEHVGYDPDVLVTSVHTESYNHSIHTEKNKSQKRPGMISDFHVYSIEWLPDKIKFFFDDDLQFTYIPTAYKENPSWKEWPFDRRFHLLINLAYGGNWGGARGVDYNVLPAVYEIDYVRVYQSPEINAFTYGP